MTGIFFIRDVKRSVRKVIEINSTEITQFYWNPSLFNSPLLKSLIYTPTFLICCNDPIEPIQIFAYIEKYDTYKKLIGFGREQHKTGKIIGTWAPYIGRTQHLIVTSDANKICLWKCDFNFEEETNEIKEITADLSQLIPVDFEVFLRRQQKF